MSTRRNSSRSNNVRISQENGMDAWDKAALDNRHNRMPGSLILDSVTVFPPEARGHAAIAASHGGDYAAYLAAKAGLKAVILCDAGVGRERAGIGGLDLSRPARRRRPPQSAIARRASATARIVMQRGVITFANKLRKQRRRGRRHGGARGAGSARARRPAALPAPPAMNEARHELVRRRRRRRARLALDSTGAGATRGRRPYRRHRLAWRPARRTSRRPRSNTTCSPRSTTTPTSASTMPASARLPALDARGIAGATASAPGARASATGNRHTATASSPP